MKELSKNEMYTVLHKVNDGVLALSNRARPYCIPFGFVYVNDAVFLSMFPLGRKWEYFQNNPEVCFNVFCWNADHTEWHSVVIDGEMELVTDIQAIESVVRANIEKTGLDPGQYLERRMEYYRKSIDNPKALKVFKIKAASIGGRKMRTVSGES